MMSGGARFQPAEIIDGRWGRRRYATDLLRLSILLFVIAACGSNSDPDPDDDPNVPNTTITEGPSGALRGSDASFTFQSSLSGSTFTCQLDVSGLHLLR